MKKRYLILVFLLVFIAVVSLLFLNNQSHCQRLYNEIKSDMEQANYCQTDSDCDVLILGGSYVEFGCYHFVNKEVDKQQFFDRMDEYSNSCTKMINRCAPMPEPRCFYQQCVYVEE